MECEAGQYDKTFIPRESILLGIVAAYFVPIDIYERRSYVWACTDATKQLATIASLLLERVG